MELLYIPIILLLYLRTYKYKKLIDDPVPRDGYLYEVSRENVDPKFYEEIRPLSWTFTNIVTFLAVCGYIHILWGWEVALMFSVFPLNVCGVAWGRTGNYYMSTILLVLSTHICLVFDTTMPLFGATMPLESIFIFKMVMACLFYGAALNSTLSAVSYLPIGIYFGGWYLIVPFLFFIFGKRLRTGISKRKEKHEDRGIDTKKLNLLHVPKTIAYYVYLSIWPSRLGMFHALGKTREYWTIKFLLVSIFICIGFCIVAYLYNPLMCVWWLLGVGIYSQFITLGQHTAERYTLFSNIAFCITFCSMVGENYILYAIICTLYFYRSHLYIPSYKHNEDLFAQSLTAFPSSPENYNNYAGYLLKLSPPRYADAVKPLLCALVLSDGNKYGLHINLAKCYEGLFNRRQALYHLEQALPIAPKNRQEAIRDQIFKVKRKARKG